MAARYVFATPPGNPLMQVLYFIVGTILLIGAVVMGAVIIAFVIGLALIFGIVIWARVMWLRHKFRRAAKQGGRAGDTGSMGRAGGFGGTGRARGSGSMRSAGGSGGADSSSEGVEITEVEYRVVRETRPDDD